MNEPPEPCLRIIEQPEPTTRLRYQSEKKHGFLLGANSPPGAAKSDKSYPKVELMNHSGKARIEVRLCQEPPCDELHPANEGLKLKWRRQQVPQRYGSYVASFNQIKINLSTNDEVRKWLMKTTKKTYEQCKPLEETINKYAVRLRFSAHHPKTGAMICPPVFSNTVKHCKEKLSVVNYMNFRGSSKGSQPLWILVEGVNTKKNMRVVFFEEMPDGSRHEFDEVRLNDTHFHHIHTIMIQVPPYPNEITEIKEVKFLLRDVTDPDDPRESESRTYEYYPHKVPMAMFAERTHKDSTSTSSSSTGYSSMQTETLPKRHKRPTSKLRMNCRKQLSSRAGCKVSAEVVDLTSDDSSEGAMSPEDVMAPGDVMSPKDVMTPEDVMTVDDMRIQQDDDMFDINMMTELDQLENTDIPTEQVLSKEMFTKEMSTDTKYEYQSAYLHPMTSLSDPVLGEVNMLMNNNYQSQHQMVYDVDSMDVDKCLLELPDYMSIIKGETRRVQQKEGKSFVWVSDSAKPQNLHKKNDCNHRNQHENMKTNNKITIYKTSHSQHAKVATPLKKIKADAQMCYIKLEAHDANVLQCNSSSAESSSGEEYETAEESEEEMVLKLQVMKTE